MANDATLARDRGFRGDGRRTASIVRAITLGAGVGFVIAAPPNALLFTTAADIWWVGLDEKTGPFFLSSGDWTAVGIQVVLLVVVVLILRRMRLARRADEIRQDHPEAAAPAVPGFGQEASTGMR